MDQIPMFQCADPAPTVPVPTVPVPTVSVGERPGASGSPFTDYRSPITVHQLLISVPHSLPFTIRLKIIQNRLPPRFLEFGGIFAFGVEYDGDV